MNENKQNMTMSEAEGKKLIPELRFPEFKNSGEWVVKKVEDFFDVASSKRVLQKDWTDKGIPFYRTRELVSLSKNEPFNSEIFISEELFEQLSRKYGVPIEGDLLVSGVGTLGISYQVKAEDKFYFKDGNVLWFKHRDNNIISAYFNHCFHTQYVQNQIFGQSSASTVGTYTIQNAKKTKFWVAPSKQEQQKIAAFLSNLDALIDAHKQKLELLKQHKKGLMQNLFPQEGEKVPKFRFPEFKDSGEWEVELFSGVYTFKSTNSFSRNKLNYDKGYVKNIHYGDIHTKFSTLFDITKENVPFINDDISIERINQDSFCVEGDIIIADASEDIEDVGKSIEIVNLNNEKILSGLHTILVRQLKPKLIIGFGGYLFKSNFIRNQIKNEAQGAKVLGISKGRISNISICYPKNKQEQQKIASCLSSLDEWIEAQAEKIEQLERHKKGLMQKMFPASSMS